MTETKLQIMKRFPLSELHADKYNYLILIQLFHNDYNISPWQVWTKQKNNKSGISDMVKGLGFKAGDVFQSAPLQNHDRLELKLK